MALPFLSKKPVSDDYLLFKPDALIERGRANAQNYQSAEPFPHIVLDDFIPQDVVRTILKEFPGTSDPYWKTKRVKTSVKQDSRRVDKEVLLPPYIRRAMWELNSAAFMLFLQELTGIKGLLPDPYLEGGGIHQIEPGGFLEVHADFNVHPLMRTDRRLNALIYLNEDWDPSYGGDLELWSTDMTRCEKKVAPLAGRCVIFSTTDTSYHGHPEPLTCPPGRTRKSLALYYYTAGRPESERSAEHSTLYQTRPEPVS